MGKQKRSENTYQKINTIFMRDAKNVIMPYEPFVEPEFEYLRGLKWRGECKIDGTNMRIEVTKEPIYVWAKDNDEPKHEPQIGDMILAVKFNVRIAGKTDNAQIPPKLLKFMEENYPKEKVLASLGLKEFIPVEEWEVEHNWLEYDQIPNIYTIYGEGYGAGIQKAGGNYIKDGVGFIVFDVKVNDIYLKTDARDDIANKLGAPIVPLMGYFTLDEAIEYVRKGFKTGLWDNKDFIEEGLVLRTDLGLRNRMGKRLIVKVKYEDFQKYRAVYGTDEKVEQPKNENYVK
jgi:hypothetical protein